MQPLSVIHCTPIGIIFTEDQDGLDSKIIASPISKIVGWSAIEDSNDFNPHLLNKLKHFIEHHKDLEKEKAFLNFGLHIICFTNSEVTCSIDDVLSRISSKIVEIKHLPVRL